MKRRLLALTMALLMLVSLVPMQVLADDNLLTEGSVTVDTIFGAVTYTLQGGTMTVTGEGYCDETWKETFDVNDVTKLVINEGITGIDYAAFRDCTALQSVTVPESVTLINTDAFKGCSALSSISLPDSLTEIGMDAFKGTAYYNDRDNWKSNCVLYIGKYLIEADIDVDGEYRVEDGTLLMANGAFCGNRVLTSVIIPDSMTTISYAFAYCTALENVTLPEGVTTIDGFYACSSLKSITLPESVTTILDYAFSYCTALEDINLPDGLTKIGRDAFLNTAYYNNPDNWDGDMLYIGKYLVNAKEELAGDCTVKDGTLLLADYVFLGNTALTSVTLPEGLTHIGFYAFSGCTALSSVTMSEGLTYIGQVAFSQTALKNVVLPESVTKIDFLAFWNCSALESITIPENVTYIGGAAFWGCNALTDVYYDGTQGQWAKINIRSSNDCLLNAKLNIVTGTQTEGTVEVDDSTYTLENGTLTVSGDGEANDLWTKTFDREAITEIEIAEGTTSIGGYAFADCNSLQSVTIPESVTEIGDSAFSGCNSLQSVTIPESVTEIGDSAFSGCNSLQSVEIPESVTEIGDSAFDGCNSLESVTIPENVTEIGNNAFSDCYALSSVTLPDGLTEIGDEAFAGCVSLSSVALPDGLTEIGDEAFAGCVSLSSVTLSDASSEISRYARMASDGITLPDGLTRIGTKAFFNTAYYNDDANWQGNVLYIGSYLIEARANSGAYYTVENGTVLLADSAFSGCTALKIVTIPESVTAIGVGAFSGCTSLTDVYYDGTRAQWKQIVTGSGNDELQSATLHPSNEYPFTDVDVNDKHAPFAEAILWAVKNGITAGYSSSIFGPNDSCTRAQVVTFIWRAAGCPEPQSMTNPFTDVPETSPFYKAILWAVEEGITSGYGNGLFGLNDSCTRAQVVTFLWRYAGRPEVDASANIFSDTQNLNSDYKAAIAWATEVGITAGYSSANREPWFEPGSVCKRTHVVTFLWRYEINK